MEKFIEKLRSDEAFAKEFREYLKGADEDIKAGTRQVADQLNKLVQKTITEFAKKKGMDLSDSEEVATQLGTLCKQIGMQLDEMIIKQFMALDLTQNAKK